MAGWARPLPRRGRHHPRGTRRGAHLALGTLILTACLLRPFAPLAANIATAAIAIWSVLWFWLGAAPIGALAVTGAMADMLLRVPPCALLDEFLLPIGLA